METEQVKVSKRIIAYLLDIILLVFIIGLVTSIRFINPNYDKYMDTYEKYSNVLEDYYNSNIDEQEMINLNKENYYYLTKYSVNYNIAIIIVIIAYFVFFQKYNNGQTIGKKIMKIKVVGTEKEPSIFSYFIRTIAMYYIYVGSILPLVINTLLVYFFNVNNYLVVATIINYIFTFLAIISFVLILVRKDKRGIHELITNTKVVYE